MRYANQHLSADELESLGKGEGLSGGRGEDLGAAREHVQSCPSCRRRLEVYPNTGAKLEQLRAPKGIPKGPDCPPVEVWLKLAGGLLSTTERDRYTAHAATCDHCGPVLRQIVHDFEEPVTEEEKAALAELKDSGSIPQDKSGTPVIPSKVVSHPWRWFGLPGWQVATAAVVILAAVSFSLYKVGVFNKEDSVASVNQLLAEAYTEQRTSDWRFPGARYAPIHQLRNGLNADVFSRPKQLIAAELTIQEHLSAQPNNPMWLRSKGEAELLEREYENAKKSFESAIAINSNSPDLHNDLGMAFYALGQSDRKDECARAVEEFSRALELRSNDTVILFNRALANECSGAYSNAVADWNAYLAVDDDSEWAHEAKQRLNRLQKLENSIGPIEKTPKLFSIPEGQDNEEWKRIDIRIEEYLDYATSNWLPLLFEPPKTLDLNIRTSVVRLANHLESEHGDSWLLDIANVRQLPGFRSALLYLAQAIRLNAEGNPEAALNDARVADRFFTNVGLRPGILRAQYEELYALRRLVRPCYVVGKSMAHNGIIQHYPWLGIQILLEFSSCAILAGKLDQASQALLVAQQYSQLRKYHGLRLRVFAFQAALQKNKGNFSEAWKEDMEGITEFWNGNFPPIRGYVLYSDMSFLAEEMGLWNSSYALQIEAVHLISFSINRLAEVLARNRLANLAVINNRLSQAKAEFDEADRIASKLPRNPTLEILHADGELGLAKIEVALGLVAEPLARLSRIEGQIAQIASYRITQRFYATLGELQFRERKLDAAENSLLAAVSAAEATLASIRNTRERLTWDHEVDRTYRLLVLVQWQQQRFAEALRTWQWYRTAVLRVPTSRAPGNSTFHALPRPDRQFLRHQQTWFASHFGYAGEQDLHIFYANLIFGTAVWAVDSRRITPVWIDVDSENLTQEIKEFVYECADGHSDLVSLRKHSHVLYDVLLKPIDLMLAGKQTLVIVPDGLVSVVPFAALLDQKEKYLGERFRITFSIGIGYKQSIQSKSLGSSFALVIAASGIGQGFDPIDPLTEARQVQSYFPNAILLSGEFATPEHVLKYISYASLFHFAGHAFSNQTQAALIFATQHHGSSMGNEILDATRIEKLRLREHPLIVLSACSTGVDWNHPLWDPDNIVRAFFTAGASQVVASQWNVDSTATTIFMQNFYSTLRSTGSVDVGLQAASSAIRQDPLTRHPYYWAAFSVFGAPDH